MFTTDEILTATLRNKEEEAKGVIRLKEAHRARRGGRGRGWRWRIEPGMEESFRYLLGWVIPGREGEVGGGTPSESRAA